MTKNNDDDEINKTRTMSITRQYRIAINFLFIIKF